MAKMIRWEYKRLMLANTHPHIIEECNALGLEGWELVSCAAIGSYNDYCSYLFKRDKDWQDKEDCGQDE